MKIYIVKNFKDSIYWQVIQGKSKDSDIAVLGQDSWLHHCSTARIGQVIPPFLVIKAKSI